MQSSSYHYFPISWPFLLALFFLFVIALAFIEVWILKYAYTRMGIPPRYVLLILLLSLIGSQINIPVAELPPGEVDSNKIVAYHGMHYVIPHVEHWQGTILAVNVGGALIPLMLSIYLIVQNGLYLSSLVGIAIVTVVVHWLAEPVPGVGIAVPIYIPPIVAALVAMILNRRKAPPLAYIVGSMGTLIGADILNIGRLYELKAPIASIGGAGTFDGIFVTGIFAVLLSPATAPREADGRVVRRKELPEDR